MFKFSSTPITFDTKPLKLIINDFLSNLSKNYYKEYNPLINCITLNIKSNVAILMSYNLGLGDNLYSEDSLYNIDTNKIIIRLDYNYMINNIGIIKDIKNDLLKTLVHECTHYFQGIINNNLLSNVNSSTDFYYNSKIEHEAFFSELGLELKLVLKDISNFIYEAKLNNLTSSVVIEKILRNLIGKEHYNLIFVGISKERKKEILKNITKEALEECIELNPDMPLTEVREYVKETVKVTIEKRSYKKMMTYIYKFLEENSGKIFNNIISLRKKEKSRILDEIKYFCEKQEYPNVLNWLNK